jgi:hypothetical protein
MEERMARGNGKKDPIVQVVEELRGLRSELKGEMGALRSELKSEMAELRTELGDLRNEVHLGFTQVNLRIDKLIENTGSHYRAGGVRAILEHLGLPTASARLAPARGPHKAAWC